MRNRTTEGAEATQAPMNALRRDLSAPMLDLLWTVAQHKYGWTHVQRYRGGTQVAEALERRGLVAIDHDKTYPTLSATDAGRAEIARRWPVSPFVLGTYEHQPGGWTPRDMAPEQ